MEAAMTATPPATPATLALVVGGFDWLEAFASLPPALRGLRAGVDDIDPPDLVGAVVPDGRRVIRLVEVEERPYPCGYDCCGVLETRVVVEVE